MILSATKCSVSIDSFATVIGAPVGKTSASLSSLLVIELLWNFKNNAGKKTILKTLKDNEISHGDFTTIINDEINYCELTGSIRIMKSQRSNIKRYKLIKDGLKMGIDEIIKQNKRIKKKLLDR